MVTVCENRGSGRVVHRADGGVTRSELERPMKSGRSDT